MSIRTRASSLVSIARFPALALALIIASPASAQAAPSAAVAPEAETLPLFAILYRPGPNWTPDLPLAEQGLLEHFYYMRDLHQRGRIVLAGPLGEDGGLVIVRAADQAEADQIKSADPAVMAGKFVGAATPFVARFAATK